MATCMLFREEKKNSDISLNSNIIFSLLLSSLGRQVIDIKANNLRSSEGPELLHMHIILVIYINLIRFSFKHQFPETSDPVK